MFTVIVLAPLVWYWFIQAEFAVRYANSAQDWRANHRSKVELEIWAALIAGVLAAGAMVRWIVATMRVRARGFAAVGWRLTGRSAAPSLWVVRPHQQLHVRLVRPAAPAAWECPGSGGTRRAGSGCGPVRPVDRVEELLHRDDHPA
ncbi:hypothetical protein GCM10023317_89270 [Actinopolymorpha pittospori]